MIRFENVSKVYARGARPALDTVSVDIARGEFVFLVGASGSGKSTFLRLALREERPTRGRIYVAGRDLSRLSGWKVPSLRRSIGMVFQDFRLLPNKSVYENVAFALEVIGRPRHVIKTTVPEVLEMVGLDGKEKRRPHELSGGEQQRVAIARAFVNRPPILLADEPTGNLDPTTSLGIMRLLERINRTGTTVVMATHDDEIVNEMRKRVVELSGGHTIRDDVAGVYGERERILPDVAASPVLDAPGAGERQAHRTLPDVGDLEAEAKAEAAAAAEPPPSTVTPPSSAVPVAYAVPAPYAATRPVDPSAQRPPSDADDVVRQVLRERAVRTGREG
ncbi:cell division ATP-binding protein FtsE [Xylanimonas cellulosilytica DSM 15894]|uniref:Cell division ATP-binding protein FtsE n=1 Tax=Xylanimonas cellulosilytica (strain DSM 15894 / JCM 12276 / CECT 5975 / KCTC 9989 / LMG 20990 / NBRC 107835 / XIL07) TaxID=446471 RepID=D1BYZ1_XYLCX|nr:cell division ATP-binding protein FtsE [Xylanimonas cellulosilytica DSM 15894]